MKPKITITLKQAQQFNSMLHQLKRIKAYDSVEKLRRSSEKNFGLEFEEAIEMAYENMQGEAQIKGIKPIQIAPLPSADPKTNENQNHTS